MGQKLSAIGAFFARRRAKSFGPSLAYRINWHLFPHLEHEKDNGYPFQSDDEFREEIARSEAQLHKTLETIKQQAPHMGKAFGKGFRYFLYRDLNERLRLYAFSAKRQVRPTTVDPRTVATCLET